MLAGSRLRMELERWDWSNSPHVARTLGWDGTSQELTTRLERDGLWSADEPKPKRPKECMEEVLRRQRVPRSSALYRQLAEHVGLGHCRDPAFAQLCDTLRRWFPAE